MNKCSLTGFLSEKESLTGFLSINEKHCEYDIYKGPYSITPKMEKQMLNTKDTLLETNITILEIPYCEISNDYGKTAYIGRTDDNDHNTN